MIALFQAYFHMTIAACLVILVTLAVRPVFKKFSNRIACLLWAVVLLRLLCPVALKIPSLPQRANPVIEAEFSSQSIETSGDLFKDNTSESEYVSGSQTAKEYLQTVHVSTIAQDRQAAKASEHINVSKPGETGGDLLAQIPLDMEASDWTTCGAPIHAEGKKTALFFRYEGEGALDLYSFTLE